MVHFKCARGRGWVCEAFSSGLLALRGEVLLGPGLQTGAISHHQDPGKPTIPQKECPLLRHSLPSRMEKQGTD